ncbi:MAG: hypothetical protein JSU68_13735 [Phycisphaerales bacterium]|nr:MAG: hypothetical protein JSU68_13735 [Phycisphaerales bacterium]
MPDEVHDAEARNLMEIERYLTFRIYGIFPAFPLSLPRPRIDLAGAMKRHAETPPLRPAESAPPGSAVLYFN